MNELLRRAKGEKVVIWQDAISCGSKFLEEINRLPCLDTCWTFPVIKDGKTDWRATGYENSRSISKIPPHYWETDLAMAPLKAFFDVGGFDESFDDGWSWDNVEIAWRLNAAGYVFFVDPNHLGNAVDHDKIVEHPFRGKLPNNDKKANETARQAERGKYKLDYLIKSVI